MRGAERGLLTELASCATFVNLESSLIFTLLREAEQRALPGVPVVPGPFC